MAKLYKGNKLVSILNIHYSKDGEPEEITINPTQAVQEKTPSEGKYISKVTVNAIQTESKTIKDMDFSEQSVLLFSPTSGKYISAVAVPRPANLAAENIKKGIIIEGITGTLSDETTYAEYNTKNWGS